MDINLEELCKLAKEAALNAGKIIAAKQGGTIQTQSKTGGENLASQVVTEIDLQAEKAILTTLKPSLQNIGLLAEETAAENNSRFDKDYFWCIDPLDGTLAFSRDEDGYSTSIALVSRSGEPMLGVVFNPRHNNLYWAIKGRGAFKNDKKLTSTPAKNTLTLLYDASYFKDPRHLDQIKKLRQDSKALGLDSLEIHHLGGAVMNGISTIDMAPAIYFKFPKKAQGGGSLWDFAASSIIQREAGGWNSNYYQRPLDLNREDSTFMNHEGVIFCSDKSLLEIIPKI